MAARDSDMVMLKLNDALRIENNFQKRSEILIFERIDKFLALSLVFGSLFVFSIEWVIW